MASPGCRNEAPESEQEVAPVARGIHAAPSIRVHVDNTELVFRYYDKDVGALATATAIEEVPQEVRSAVIVMDMTAKDVPARALYVTDLTRKNDDGTHPWRVVDRYSYQHGGKTAAQAQGSTSGSGSKVVLYSTEWCGACKSARKWFKAQNISFTERDLEKDPGAVDALKTAARKAGMHPSSVLGSVPIVVVGKQLLKGFDPGAVKAAMGR
jgi:arsenate reductase-like glutaredoxin family protein